MNSKLIFRLLLVPFLFLPVVVLAYDFGNVPMAPVGFGIENIANIVISAVWKIAAAFFVVMFLVASFRFFTAGGDENKLHQARMSLAWVVVGFVVALAAYSIPPIVITFFNNP